MSGRPDRRRRYALLRWSLLGVATVVLVTFLVAQRQSVDVSYGRSPSSATPIQEGAAGELGDVGVPSVAQMTAMVDAEPVVRLPGSTAHWNEQRVREAIGDGATRILVAPPGLDEQERDRVRAVRNATVRVIGTEVSGGIYLVRADTPAGWRAQFATGDVTDQLVTLIHALGDRPAPPDRDELRWREPASREVDTVAADLRATGLHVAAGATLSAAPTRAVENAFPAGALVVALPPQPYGQPVPRYGPALTTLFPDTPIVVMYGLWVEYHGPAGADFADVAAASFYGQFAARLSRYDHPQDHVLAAYLDRVTDIRYAGLFDRPLPYRPVDPLRVALPALPGIFAACVAAFLFLSFRSLRRAGRAVRPGDPARGGAPARLAGLTALAVEASLLTDARSNPALARAVVGLQAAREALDEGLPDRHVRTLLDDAAAELDDAARTMGIASYRPDVYLRGRLS